MKMKHLSAVASKPVVRHSPAGAQAVAAALASVKDARDGGLAVDDAFLAEVARQHRVPQRLLRVEPTTRFVSLSVQLSVAELERMLHAARSNDTGEVLVDLEELEVSTRVGLCRLRAPIRLDAKARKALPAAGRLQVRVGSEIREVSAHAATEAVALGKVSPAGGWTLGGRAKFGCPVARRALAKREDATAKRDEATAFEDYARTQSPMNDPAVLAELAAWPTDAELAEERERLRREDPGALGLDLEDDDDAAAAAKEG